MNSAGGSVRCLGISIPCSETVLFLSNFFELSSTVFKISVSLLLFAKVDFDCS